MDRIETYQKGITKERLLNDLLFLKTDIRKYVSRKLYQQTSEKRDSILREYGSLQHFLDDTFQELYLYCYFRLGRIPENLTYRYIFYYLKHLLKGMIYKHRIRVLDYDFADEQESESEGFSDEYLDLLNGIKNVDINETEKRVIYSKINHPGDISLAEISKKLGISYANAANSWNRGLHKMRIYLVQNYDVDKILNPSKSFTINTYCSI